MVDGDWNFANFGAVTAQVIPTLLLAFVLTKELLPVVVASSRQVARVYTEPTATMRQVLKIMNWIPPDFGLSTKAIIWLARPSSIVFLAMLAEILSLLGVVSPTTWYADSFGRIVALTVTAYIGLVVFLLIIYLMEGLMTVVWNAETAAAAEEGVFQPPSPGADDVTGVRRETSGEPRDPMTT